MASRDIADFFTFCRPNRRSRNPALAFPDQLWRIAEQPGNRYAIASVVAILVASYFLGTRYCEKDQELENIKKFLQVMEIQEVSEQLDRKEKSCMTEASNARCLQHISVYSFGVGSFQEVRKQLDQVEKAVRLAKAPNARYLQQCSVHSIGVGSVSITQLQKRGERWLHKESEGHREEHAQLEREEKACMTEALKSRYFEQYTLHSIGVGSFQEVREHLDRVERACLTEAPNARYLQQCSVLSIGVGSATPIDEPAQKQLSALLQHALPTNISTNKEAIIMSLVYTTSFDNEKDNSKNKTKSCT